MPCDKCADCAGEMGGILGDIVSIYHEVKGDIRDAYHAVSGTDRRARQAPTTAPSAPTAALDAGVVWNGKTYTVAELTARLTELANQNARTGQVLARVQAQLDAATAKGGASSTAKLLLGALAGVAAGIGFSRMRRRAA